MVRQSVSAIRTLAVGLSLLLLTGCTFEREWRAAANQPWTGGMDGRWEGTWLSHTNGHNGKLRAVIKRRSGETYDVHYHATYFGCIPFAFRTKLQAASCECGKHHFTGREDLGCLAGGVYTYNGHADR